MSSNRTVVLFFPLNREGFSSRHAGSRMALLLHEDVGIAFDRSNGSFNFDVFSINALYPDHVETHTAE